VSNAVCVHDVDALSAFAGTLSAEDDQTNCHLRNPS